MGSNDSEGHEREAPKHDRHKEDADIEEIKQAPQQRYEQREKRGGGFKDPASYGEPNGNLAQFYCNDECFKMNCIYTG